MALCVGSLAIGVTSSQQHKLFEASLGQKSRMFQNAEDAGPIVVTDRLGKGCDGLLEVLALAAELPSPVVQAGEPDEWLLVSEANYRLLTADNADRAAAARATT